jgi:hypothetical protein|tara:strand:+ start:516 stop:944 length:429 start_codon:yes stop_codon:yes gene_type:complete
MNIELVENIHDINTKDDPVRKNLSYRFRTTQGRKIYMIKNKAVVCVANAIDVPINIEELKKFSNKDTNEFTIFYTLWSYKKGYGTIILNTLLPMLKTKRYVTLSPKTTMAYNFHTKNGAKLLSINSNSYNFEYFKNSEEQVN